jgi:uncharacterized membrane protein YeaQ/YmgE (transglycosylase-associated protein family)
VWHWIAFIVIGLVIGWFFSRGSSKPVLVIVLGLIGGLVGGLVIIYGVGQQHHTIVKYGSIIVSIVLALILAFLGQRSQKA